MGLWDQITGSFKNASTLDYVLLGVVGVIMVRYVLRRIRPEKLPEPEPQLPPMKKKDMTKSELKNYDGSSEDGRLLLAVDGKIFDVTRAKRLYGKDGPYGLFAGRDASRGLATFTINNEAVKDEDDDLSDLSAYEIESMKEWSQQFSEKYPVIGKLLKDGETPTVYDDEEEEQSSRSKDD